MAATTKPRALVLKAPPEPDPLESWHQEQVMLMIQLNKRDYPEATRLYAVPNGGFRHKSTAAAMQRQGVKSGVPDMALDVARGGYLGLKIELKRFRTGTVSEAQKDWLAWQQEHGYRAIVCWGWRAAWDEITGYLSLSPTTVQ